MYNVRQFILLVYVSVYQCILAYIIRQCIVKAAGNKISSYITDPTLIQYVHFVYDEPVVEDAVKSFQIEEEDVRQQEECDVPVFASRVQDS